MSDTPYGEFSREGLIDMLEESEILREEQRTELAALRSLLKEAGETLKYQRDVINRWYVFEKPFGEQELSKRFGENPFPDSSIYCEEWLDRVLRLPTAEANRRAADIARKIKEATATK